jgi:iron complex outermembrane receptor protein
MAVVDNQSLNVGSADVQGNNVTIRGITPGLGAGGAAPTGISTTPGVAVYVDGVYEGVGGNYDLARVEVLRGPQGTLYGRSATSGVVAFHTRNPTLDGFGGNASAEFADFNLRHYSAGVNIPLATGLAVRVASDYYDQGAGFFGQASSGMGKRTNGRAKLLWQPSDSFSLLVGAAYEQRDNFSGGSFTTAAPPTLAFTTVSAVVLPSHKEQRQYWAEVNWDLGPVKLTYLPALRTWEQNDHMLGDANFIGSGAAREQKILTPTDKFQTHELRVASRDGSRVQWQAGAFYYRNELVNSNQNYLSVNAVQVAVLTSTSDQKQIKSLGAFAEATLPLTSSLRATLGARYDSSETVVSEVFFDSAYTLCGTVLASQIPGYPFLPGVSCTGPGQANAPQPPFATTTLVDQSKNFDNFNYKARLEYDLTPKNMVFGMISTGYRPGDVRIARRAKNVVNSEKLTSIEVGSKNRFLGDSLQLNVGIYYYRYQGFPAAYIPNTPSPVDYAFPGNSLDITVPARLLGSELELLYRLTANDRVGFNYNYVESKWVDKSAAFASAQPETKRALTPTTITANYEHLFNLAGGSTVSARIDGKYEAAHVTQNLHADWLAQGYGQYAQVGSRTIGNLSAVWMSNGGKWSIVGYVRNFTDKHYASYTIGGDPLKFSVARTDPRVFGGTVSVRF